MSFDYRKFISDHGIQTRTEGHKHCRPGWIQTPCPFCTGNAGWHLGWEERKDSFVCWRCGGKRHIDVIAALLNIPIKRAGKVWKDYKGRPRHRESVEITPKIRRGKVKLPPGTGPMMTKHKRYLRGRKFDPDALASIWGLLGTGPLGDYKFRILAPIYRDNILISYQCRDITGKSDLPYKACAQKNEVIDHKESLYGLDLVPGDRVVVVEGIADAWRLGPGAVATFGIKYKNAQVRLLKRFQHRFILFDPADPQAVKQGEKLANELSAFRGITEFIDIPDKDPGDMDQKDANEMMKDLLHN